mgnify:CR=1 FL=1
MEQLLVLLPCCPIGLAPLAFQRQSLRRQGLHLLRLLRLNGTQVGQLGAGVRHLRSHLLSLGVALCLPQTIGSTTGGMVFYTAGALGKLPACMCFSKPIDSLAAAGAILSDVWTETHMPVVDSLGDEFLEYVKTGMNVTLAEDGTVTVE